MPFSAAPTRSKPLRFQQAAALGLANGAGQACGHGLRQHRVPRLGLGYTIGPWKLFGGYEHINYANPNNPLCTGCLQFGWVHYHCFPSNNAAFPSDKILQTAWVGVRYAITPCSRHHRCLLPRVAEPVCDKASLIDKLAQCAANGVASSQCSGTLPRCPLVVDWRFARHVDMYAGVMWSQVRERFG